LGGYFFYEVTHVMVYFRRRVIGLHNKQQTSASDIEVGMRCATGVTDLEFAKIAECAGAMAGERWRN
jgi:hypothetical protein